MAPVPLNIPFATQSDPKEFREQGNERMINAFVTFNGSGKDAKITIRMSPGQTSRSTDADDIACRGAIRFGDYAYVVFDTGVYKIEISLVAGVLTCGSRTLIGSITGTGKVYMALNANDQIGVVNQIGRYYVIENDTVTNISTSDIGAFNSISWIEGYFILTLENGEFYNTELNDAYTISGDFAVAEGSPDGLLGGFAHGSELWLPGKNTVEVWGNAGNSTGSPFSRLGSAWLNIGCMSFASFVGCANTVAWIGNDGIVYKNANYNQRRISHEGVERAIASAASPETIEGFTYTIDGHIYYGISDANFTWVFDFKTERWHERKSYGSSRWSANIFIPAFSKWLVGTTNDGNLYELDMTSRLEGALPIVSEMNSVDNGKTPLQGIVSEIEVDFVTGRASLSGTVPQTAPMAEVSYSDDGGATYSGARELLLGAQGEYNKRCRAMNLGCTNAKFGRRWKLRTSDPHIMAMSRFLAHVEATGPS